MAESKIKKLMKDAIRLYAIDVLVDHSTSIDSYIDTVANVILSGYTPISIGYKVNQININVYECRLDGNTAHVGVATIDGAHLAHVNLTIYVTYIRNDFIYS